MPFCNNCGQEYTFDQHTCINCNTQLEDNISGTLSNNITTEILSSKTQRVIAGSIDIIVAALLFFIFLWAKPSLFIMSKISRVLSILAPGIYLMFKDCIDGKSVGKLIMGLTVYNTLEKKPSGISDSINRNWFLVIPILGPAILSVVLFFQIIFRNKRWGDGMAKTIVIQDSKAGLL